MNAPTLEVLALQLRQVQSLLEALSNNGDGLVWKVPGMRITDVVTIATRLDDARYAVRMAHTRASSELAEAQKPLPACADDRRGA